MPTFIFMHLWNTTTPMPRIYTTGIGMPTITEQQLP